MVEEEHIKGVVSMNETYELKYLTHMADGWAAHGVSFLQLPTTDIFHAPCQEKLVEGVAFMRGIITEETENNLRNGHAPSVYVHCKAGRTRSATLVGCYLMAVNGWTPEQAVECMKRARPHVLLHNKQWEALRDFHRRNVKGSS